MRHKDLAIDVLLVPVVLFATYFLLNLDSGLGVVIGAGLVVAAVPLVVRRVAIVRESEHPVLDAMKALAVFVSVWLIGFSTFYYSLAARNGDEISGLETKLDSLYFTVTVLSTVGFGDITATGQVARGVVTANMLLNLVALGVVVKGLTWAARQRFEETGKGLLPARVDRRSPDET